MRRFTILEVDGEKILVENSTQITKGAGERNPGTSNEYDVGVPECNYFLWQHDDGDTTVTSNPALLFGWTITSTLTGDVALRDGTSAAGTLIDTISSTNRDLPGIKLNNGIFLDDNATAGNIIVFYRDQ